MLIGVDTHSGVPIYRQVLDQIKHQILAGRLKEGDPLPSVRNLAQEIRVNPMTISKSYALLEHEGFAERRRGIGLFVTRPKQELTKRAKLATLEETLLPVVVKALHMGLSEEEVIAELRKKFHATNP